MKIANKNKIIALAIMMVIVASSFMITGSVNALGAYKLKVENIDCFKNSNQTVESVRTITDFSENKFEVYELQPSGYAIFSCSNGASIFLEGSYQKKSPFYNYITEQIYYLGPGNYFYENESGEIVNIMTNSICNSSIYSTSYTIDEANYFIAVESKENSAEMRGTVTQSDFNVITNHNYFRTLSQFPDNKVGTCGLVALSILLGYCDEYLSTYFVPSGSYNGQPFKSGKGTTQALHDYLFDNCLHTVLGIGSDESGYPMAGYELRETMKDFLELKCAPIKDRVTHHYAALIGVGSGARESLDAQRPVCLVMTSYNYTTSSADGKWHVAVAYGYDANNRFLVHMGWYPGGTDYSEIIISEATIHSFYTVSYN